MINCDVPGKQHGASRQDLEEELDDELELLDDGLELLDDGLELLDDELELLEDELELLEDELELLEDELELLEDELELLEDELGEELEDELLLSQQHSIDAGSGTSTYPLQSKCPHFAKHNRLES